MPFSTKWRPKGFDEAIGVTSEPTDDDGARLSTASAPAEQTTGETEQPTDGVEDVVDDAPVVDEAPSEAEAAEPEVAAEPEAAAEPAAEQEDVPDDGDAQNAEKESTD
jgi:hypothetical protein